MRYVVCAALGLVLTAPAGSALARDHSHHVRSHTGHHHAGVAYHHARHHRSYARHHSRRLAYRDDWRTARLVAPSEPYAGNFGGFSSYERPFAPRVSRREVSHNGLDSMISRHAAMNGIPESLLHRVVMRESRYNPRAVGSGGAMGLMQIKTSTARAMGYSGSASGLLDAETNITYAARYLAGAYRAAGGNEGRAVSNYARGYYYQAKAQGFSPYAQERGFGGGYTSAQYRRSGLDDRSGRQRPL
jgi:soluble lytic murein transglycosylase-like protein